MLEIIKKIIMNVLLALYEPFGFAIIMSFLFMLVYMIAKEQGWRLLLKRFENMLKSSSEFRRVLLLAFYTSLILFKTLLNRYMWLNPLSNVIGVWGLYDSNGELTTEVIENVVLFIPFIILVMWTFGEKMVSKSVKIGEILCKSSTLVFGFSLTIELLQVFLRLGTFQLSDLFYNTLGGFIGGFIYWCGYKITHRKKSEDTE